MKTQRTPVRILAGCLFCLFVFAPVVSVAQSTSTAAADTSLTPAQWASFNKNLITNLRAPSVGVRTGALRQVVRFGRYLQFDKETVFHVMRIYRDSQNLRERRLAIVALGQMKDRWAIEFLDMLAPYEANVDLQATMESVVRDYWAAQNVSN